MLLLYMTSIYLFHFFEIIYLNTFLEFLNFVYMTSKLSILSNHTEYPKKLAPYYILPFFIILKSLYLISQPACLKKLLYLRKRFSLIKKLGL